MSQPVGFQYKSRIPSFSDDADITEALKVYHYGVDDYTTQPIPDDSIEGNFRSLNIAVSAIQSQLSNLSYVQLVSQTSSPNIVTGQSITTVPLTIRSIASQTAALQQWQNSSSVNVASISTGGFANFAGYLSVGTTTQVTTTGLNLIVGNASHRGITVRAQSAQSANLQEWQDSSGSIIARVDGIGRIFSYDGSSVAQNLTVSGTQTITNKTMSGSNNAFSNIPFSALVDTAPLNIPVTTQTAQFYNLQLSDSGSMVQMNNASSNFVYVPFDSPSGGLQVGASIMIVQSGVGQTTIVPDSLLGGASVTVNGTPGLKLRTRWSVATLVKVGPNSWIAMGDLVA